MTRKQDVENALILEVLQAQQEIISRLATMETKLSSMETEVQKLNHFVYGNGNVGIKTFYDFVRIAIATIGGVCIYVAGQAIVHYFL